ncbi:LysR family transcriptional regulator [Klebsiella pneumoniae]|uniref:LysR family transcriptional regulator n=1 Tax=Klebsiella pneumoniae TaxID=573 RepID=A0A377V8C2_KLEPN|nr:LysR family transcriptional regulator [Klebsiella pneumoniae]
MASTGFLKSVSKTRRKSCAACVAATVMRIFGSNLKQGRIGMFRLEDLTLFVRAAALGSFSDAAREAGQQPAQVSAAIKRLETDPQYSPVLPVRPAACA